MMTIEICFSARMSSQADEERRHVAEALDGDSQSVDAVVDVHTVFQRAFGQAVGDAGVFSRLVPGEHSDHVL